jgi:hypothetical protein
MRDAPKHLENLYQEVERRAASIVHPSARASDCTERNDEISLQSVVGASKPLQMCMAQDKTPSEQDGSATLQDTSSLLATTQSVGSTSELREEDSTEVNLAAKDIAHHEAVKVATAPANAYDVPQCACRQPVQLVVEMHKCSLAVHFWCIIASQGLCTYGDVRQRC